MNYGILIIEDEEHVRETLALLLENAEYRVAALDSSTHLYKTINDFRPSLILLDINLPYKNGLALCKEFRAKNANIPIIMLTALGEIQDKVDAFNLGADDYMVEA
ncbi:MAG: response regulator transcription factor, partial [Pedobacter sp.]